MPRDIHKTLLVPGWLVRTLGAAFVMAGLVLPVWLIRSRTADVAEADVYSFGDGPLRPSMITLPPMPDGKVIAISETPVTCAFRAGRAAGAS